MTDKPACDQCRQRKIRCSRDWPCAACRVANQFCTITGQALDLSNSMPRGYASSQFEQKIATIAGHVDGVADLLGGLMSESRLGNDSHTSQAFNIGVPQPETLGRVVNCAEVDMYENRGLVTQATFSLRCLRQLPQNRHAHDPDGSIEAALSKIEQLIDGRTRHSIDERNTSATKAAELDTAVEIPSGRLTNRPMPPQEAALQTLADVLDSTCPTLFTMICSLAGVSDVAALCSSLYSRPDTVSKFAFITIHVLFYFVFMEAHSNSCKRGEGGDDYVPYIDTCQVNIEAGIASLPFFVPATTENIQALLLGALYGITASKPRVAQYLVTKAAQVCHPWAHHPPSVATPEQTSGIHQLLYWSIYTVEKCLCLKLGPASAMHEYNITLEPHFEFDGFGTTAPLALSASWIHLGMLEGRIYTELFSPQACRCPLLEMSQRAESLVPLCQDLKLGWMAGRGDSYGDIRNTETSHQVHNFVKGDEMHLFIALTLVSQFSPPAELSGQFSYTCLQEARRALSIHVECSALMHLGRYSATAYVNWNLLLLPFAPFFVLACHACESKSSRDLQSLHDFIVSLETAETSSDDLAFLIELCHSFYDAALASISKPESF